jgi:hypothetical protein
MESNCFLPENFLKKSATFAENIPIIIIAGQRYRPFLNREGKRNVRSWKIKNGSAKKS